MKLFITAISMTFLLSSFASQKIEKVFEDESLMKGHVTLFLSDGEIVHFKKENVDLLNKVKTAFKTSSSILMTKRGQVSSNTADKIESITLLEKSESHKGIANFSKKRLFSDPLDSGNLTTLNSYNAAQSLMDSFNGKTDDDSQCYNRAHMWTYEASFEKTINMGKLWIFFTHKYIRDFEYKWWFHVSPYANVDDSNGKYILDRGFTQVPFSVTNWKNIFIQNEANCPVVTDYRQYENNQEEQYCYLIYSHQHFWQPYQLKNFSSTGLMPTKYNDSDLKIAYKDALISWDGLIPGVDTTNSPNSDNEENYSDDYPTNNSSTTPGSGTASVPDVTIPSTSHEPTSSWVKVGESVINSNGFEGRVTGVLSETKVLVLFANSYQSVSVETRYLAVKYGSSQGFSVGDYVKNNYGEKGKVTGIFQDGGVTVKFRGASKHIWQNPLNLSRRLMYK